MVERLLRTILMALLPFVGCLVGCAVSLTPTYEIRWTQVQPPRPDAAASDPAASPAQDASP